MGCQRLSLDDSNTHPRVENLSQGYMESFLREHRFSSPAIKRLPGPWPCALSGKGQGSSQREIRQTVPHAPTQYAISFLHPITKVPFLNKYMNNLSFKRRLKNVMEIVKRDRYPCSSILQQLFKDNESPKIPLIK